MLESLGFEHVNYMMKRYQMCFERIPGTPKLIFQILRAPEVLPSIDTGAEEGPIPGVGEDQVEMAAMDLK